MRIRNCIGPYPSRRARGYIVLLDPIGSPKKCPYNCIYCPITGRVIKSDKPVSLSPSSILLKDLEYLLDKLSDIEIVLFNGMGDPLLNVFIRDIVGDVRNFLKKQSLDHVLWIKTTLYPLRYYKGTRFLEYFDKIYVKVDTGSRELFDVINDPVNGLKLSYLKDVIGSLPRDLRKRVVIEYTLVDLGGEGNWVREYVDEYIAFLHSIRAENILLTTFYRPPRSGYVKSVSRKIVDLVAKRLIEEGFSVKVVYEPYEEPYRHVVIADPVDIYSLLLRRPMTLLELRRAFNIPYSDLAYAINKLSSMKLVEEVRWRGRIFYRGLLV